MGTPPFAVESLQALHRDGFELPAVITAPDKPSGRGRRTLPSAVKCYASAHRIPLLQPVNLKDPQFLSDLKKLDAALFVVVAFRMLPREIWSMPPLGTINLHASLLPQYRGAAPVQRAIMNGETKTGVSTFFIGEKMDTGHILMREETPIYPDDTGGILHDRLMRQGAALLLQTVKQVLDGSLKPLPQDSLPTEDPLKTAAKIFREDTRINWEAPAPQIHNLIRALSPAPGAYGELAFPGGNTIEVKILLSKTSPMSFALSPGTIHREENGRIMVGAGEGCIEVLEIQPAGKRRMPAAEFVKGYDLRGTRFG